MMRQTPEIFNYIDVHTHIMAGVDDGSPDVETTRKMLRMAKADGAETVFLTPHLHPKTTYVSTETLEKHYESIARMCAKSPGVYPQVLLGQELYYTADLTEQIKNGRALRMNKTQVVLTEFRFSAPGREIQQAVNQLRMQGLRPIIAHVERCGALTVEDIAELKELGALIQVNADSVLGGNGRWAKKLIRELMKQDLIDCVGSDAHNCTSRPPCMQAAFQETAGKFGTDYARAVFADNACRLMINADRDT